MPVKLPALPHPHLPPPKPILLLLRRLQNLKATQQTLIHTHHGPRIIKFATVIRRAEQRDQLALAEELVAVLDDLVRAADEIHVVLLQEAGDHVWAEREGDAAVVFGPACYVFVGVGPEEVAEETAVGDLHIHVSLSSAKLREGRWESTYISRSHHTPDLLHAIQIRAQPPMHRKDLLINNRRNRQAIEAIRKRLPQLDVVSSLALVVEAVYAVDGRALVVAAQHEEVLRVLDLVGE